jgi:MSHA biogenesis protein MshP
VPRGFALVPALFLIVVLALLATVGVRLSVGQQQSVTLALEGARALGAARAGIEWGAYEALNGSCAGQTLSLSEAALAGFTVVVSCTATSFSDAGANHTAYLIDSTARRGNYGSADYVSRRVRATFTDDP